MKTLKYSKKDFWEAIDNGVIKLTNLGICKIDGVDYLIHAKDVGKKVILTEYIEPIIKEEEENEQ